MVNEVICIVRNPQETDSIIEKDYCLVFPFFII